MDEPLSPVWIDRPAALAAIVDHLSRSGRIAVDTEADGFHAYRPKLCLIQVAWERRDQAPGVALIDVQTLEGRLEPFGNILANPSIEKIMHGADYDIRLLWRDAGARVEALFDTQIAARAVGRTRTGLAALAAEYAGVRLDKSQQTIDWSSRPLPARALDYAALDVVCLFAVRDALGLRVQQLDRQRWVNELCARQQAERSLEEPRADVSHLLEKVAEARRLDPRTRAVLGALLEWREAEASRRNRPAFKVCDSALLVRLARSAVEGAANPLGLLPERTADRYGAAIARRLEAGLSAPELPRAVRAPTRFPSSDEKRRLNALKAVRDRVARELGVEPGLIAPSAALQWIACEQPRHVDALAGPGLLGWQIDLLGERLIEALRAPVGGVQTLAVSSSPDPADRHPADTKEPDE